mgnify:CR=1 FL=1
MKDVARDRLLTRARRWLQADGGRRTATALAVCGGLCSGLPVAQAQVDAPVQDARPESVYQLPSQAVRLPSAGMHETRDADYGSSPRQRFSLADTSSLSRASLVEMPADVIPGRYTRPKFALGFRSNTMTNFAKDMGLDAQTCLLPLVRARLSLSRDGDAGGRLMVFARCTFY